MTAAAAAAARARMAALHALLMRQRAATLDASYAAYDEQPLEQPDEWADLVSFRRAAAAS